MEVIVIGGNHHNTLGVVRSLGERGIYSYVIICCSQNSSFIKHSKYLKRLWIVRGDEEVLSLLRTGFNSVIKEKAVLIACSDKLSSLVDIHKDELSHHYFLPGSEKQGQITRLMDKEVMTKLATDVGLFVPSSIAINTDDESDISIPLPWIIKPLISKNGSKTDIKRIYTVDEWELYCNSHHSSVLVQELINKEYEYQLIGLSLNGGSEVIIPGVSCCIRPAETTNTGFLYYKALDDSYRDVLEKGKSFLKATGYSGLFSLEFLRGGGKDYFLEINFRNDGNAICVTASGVNLPYIWYLYNTGGDYRKEVSKNKIKSVYVMPEFADFYFVKNGSMKLSLWIKDIKRTDRFMVFDKHDIKPFLFYLVPFLKRQIGASKFGSFLRRLLK